MNTEHLKVYLKRKEQNFQNTDSVSTQLACSTNTLGPPVSECGHHLHYHNQMCMLYPPTPEDVSKFRFHLQPLPISQNN